MHRVSRRDVLAGGTALAASAALAVPAWAKDYNLTLVSGSQIQFIWNKLIHEQFIPVANKIAKEAGDNIEWKELYGTTVKRGGEVQAVRDGIADLAFVTLTGYISELPLQNISYVVPFGARKMGPVSAAIDDLNKNNKALIDTYARYDQVYVAPFPVPSYQLWTKNPIKSVKDLDGLKLGCSGLTAGWIKGTGAVPVEGHFPSFYNGIQNGVMDGCLTWLYVGNALKMQEVAPHVTVTDFGAVSPAAITCKKELWESSPTLRKAFLEAGKVYLQGLLDGQTKLEEAAVGKIKAAGGKIRVLTDEERAEWVAALDEVPAEWAAAVDKTGLPATETLKNYIATLKNKGVKLPRDWKV